VSLPDWLSVSGYVIGSGGLLGGAVLLFKAKPEARKLNAESAKVIVDAAAALVQGVEKDIAALRTKIEGLETRAEQRDVREHQQERLLLVHERWDIEVATKLRDLGAAVADPPPMYPATG
jgi:hypothetical protein